MLPQVVARPQFRAGDQHDSFPNLHFRSGAQLYVPGARLIRAVFDNSRPRARIFALVRGLSRLVPHGIHVVRAFRPLGTCRNRVPTNHFQVVGCTNRSASCTNCAPTCTNCPTTCTNYRTPCTNDLMTCTHRLTTCTNPATANSTRPPTAASRLTRKPQKRVFSSSCGQTIERPPSPPRGSTRFTKPTVPDAVDRICRESLPVPQARLP